MSNVFFPNANATVNIDVSSASARVQLTNHDRATDVRIMNNGTATVWIAYGDSTVTADTTNDIPVGPGMVEVLKFNHDGSGGLYVAAIAAGSTGKIYFTPGEGI